MSLWYSLGFQNALSPLMEQLIFFHSNTMIMLILIVSFISYFMIFTISANYLDEAFSENQLIEMFWTILPSFVLIFIGLPSIRILYLMDEIYNPILSLKIMGHQWFWSYEYSDFPLIEFDSYMIPQNSSMNEFRLLDVDNRIVIPLFSQIRSLVSSFDVIHSWTIPSLGVKADAIPGRLNQISFYSLYPGIFFGQCSEICGANHSFMPISIEVVNSSNFMKWIKNFN